MQLRGDGADRLPPLVTLHAHRDSARRTRTYRIVLTATGKTSGRELAKGVCVVDSKGEIVALDGKQSSSAGDRLAAR